MVLNDMSLTNQVFYLRLVDGKKKTKKTIAFLQAVRSPFHAHFYFPFYGLPRRLNNSEISLLLH